MSRGGAARHRPSRNRDPNLPHRDPAARHHTTARDNTSLRSHGEASPRDRFLTIYGRNPVLEALRDPRLQPVRLVVAQGSRGDRIGEILQAAERRGIRAERLPADKVSFISGNGRHDQGLALDLATPRLGPLGDWLDLHTGGPVLLLDGVTNPSNVGMIIRSAAAAGVSVVAPRKGVAELGPLVVKASAGVLFSASVLRTRTARDAADELLGAGYQLVALDGHPDTPSLWDDGAGARLAGRVALVIGGEHDGVSPAVSEVVAAWRRIPMVDGVESLNAAVAAAIACFEIVRVRATQPERDR